MPVCKKCNREFPYRTFIDGKLKSLSKRSYCLECSPFGIHNTRRIHLNPSIEERKCICKICGREYIVNKIKRNSFERCNSCYVKDRRRRIKQEVVKHKGGKCVVCGYNKCITSLDFYHLDEETKEFGISGNNFSKERLFKEIEKCVLLCKNCHGEFHEGLIQI